MINAVVGGVIVGLSIFGMVHSKNVSDRQSAFFFLGFGALFWPVSYGLWIRSRLLVTLISIPIIVVAGGAGFVLLFAPLAWSDSNIGTAYTLQFLSLFFAVLEIASLLNVFASQR
jgi:hypothetical protein